MNKFIKCDCGHGGLYLEYDTTHKLLDVSHFQYDTSLGWRQRLRYAFACLRGKPYTDMVILGDDGIDQLRMFVNLINKQNSNESNPLLSITQPITGHCDYRGQ